MFLKRFNLIFTGFLFLLFGILHIFNFLGIVRIDENIFLGFLLILYGAITVYFNLSAGQRGKLVIASTVFFIGTIVLVSNIYELIISNRFIAVSILFVLGADLMILFLDNMEEKAFLITGGFVLILSYLSLNFYKSIPSVPILSSIGLVFLDIWPVVIFLIGIVILATHKW